MRVFIFLAAVAGLTAAATATSWAAEGLAACDAVEVRGSLGTCGHCGRRCECEKYCRVICETKEIKKNVWVVKCGEFCPTLPGCGVHCGCCDGAGEACQKCADSCRNKCDPCAAEKDKCYIPPECGKVREVKKLERKEVTCKVPSYKCVVVYCCPQCGAEQGAPAKAAPAPKAPPAPPTAPALPPPPQPGKAALRSSTIR